MSESKTASKKKSIALIYHKSNVLSFQLDPSQPLFKLVGGTNFIPQDIFELMKKDSILNGKIESGIIEVVAEDVASEKPEDAYKSLKPKAKRDMISNSTNVEHLNSYLEQEKSEELKKLIQKQLEIVSAPTQYRD